MQNVKKTKYYIVFIAGFVIMISMETLDLMSFENAVNSLVEIL